MSEEDKCPIWQKVLGVLLFAGSCFLSAVVLLLSVYILLAWLVHGTPLFEVFRNISEHLKNIRIK